MTLKLISSAELTQKLKDRMAAMTPEDIIKDLRLRLETMTADRDAEKAMKAQARMERDDLTARNKILRDRPDLPVDRLPAHDKLVSLQNANHVLGDALLKLSTQLLRAGATEPQPYHSWNEKQAFIIMSQMADYGLQQYNRSLFE